MLPLTASTTAQDSGRSEPKACSLGSIRASDVVVHRRAGKSGEVFRAVVEVDCGPDVTVETFRGCLVTPEARPRCEFVYGTIADCRGPNGGGSYNDGFA